MIIVNAEITNSNVDHILSRENSYKNKIRVQELKRGIYREILPGKSVSGFPFLPLAILRQ